MQDGEWGACAHGGRTGAARYGAPRASPRRNTARAADHLLTDRGRGQSYSPAHAVLLYCALHAKNTIAGRLIPFLVLGFWDKSRKGHDSACKLIDSVDMQSVLIIQCFMCKVSLVVNSY